MPQTPMNRELHIGQRWQMSNLQLICLLCDLLDRAQQIIRQQVEIMEQHGIDTDGGEIEARRAELLAKIEQTI